VKRRELIALLGGAAAAWPLAARAQQPMPVIGYLNGTSPAPSAQFVAAFRQGLNETGYAEGRNVTIEYRWAEGRYDRMTEMAADLVRRQVAVIVASGGAAAIASAKQATATIPILFVTGSDPVQTDLVASLNRPGGNVTGVHFFTVELESKRLGLLRDLVPNAATIAVLLNPTYPNAAFHLQEVENAARRAGQQIQILSASTEAEIDVAFARLPQLRAGALLVGADPFFNSRRDQIVALAARYAIAAIYEQRTFAQAGGLASYGTSQTDAYRQVGIYTGRVLRGEKPADLPVVQSTKFEFVINLKTAKALGLEVPPGLSSMADEIIE